ncbi:MAG: DeoR/GlpR family DNA-binding transcription regulator [Pseudobutyrivibrio sp.]|nr:DeoR/GlpR family DNA-binding transcription regulator [Pseudobutyrivibrio sp.]
MAELTADRRNKIAQILLQEGSIKVGDIAERFSVSTETVRKDIIYLEELGLAEKNHGGAISKTNVVEKTLDEKEFVHPEDKTAIAVTAVSMIHDHDTIFLDTGSTTNAIARQLLLKSGLTIFTNSVLTAGILADSDNDVFLLGGRIRRSNKALIGGWALDMLDNVHADIAFLGSDGFFGMGGPSSLRYEEATIKSHAMQISSRSYVVADASKSISTSHFRYAFWSELDGIITSGDAEQKLREDIGDATSIIIAKK